MKLAFLFNLYYAQKSPDGVQDRTAAWSIMDTNGAGRPAFEALRLYMKKLYRRQISHSASPVAKSARLIFSSCACARKVLCLLADPGPRRLHFTRRRRLGDPTATAVPQPDADGVAARAPEVAGIWHSSVLVVEARNHQTRSHAGAADGLSRGSSKISRGATSSPQQKGHYEWKLADNVVRRVGKRGNLKLLARIDRQPFWSQAPGTPELDNAPPANLQDFGDFCYALADRYKGKIAAYQVWNEPNLAREWGNQPPNPAQYVELLKVCYIGIKTADPDALVISAGMAATGTSGNEAMPDDPFIEQMYQAGAAPYFDHAGRERARLQSAAGNVAR